MSLIEEALRRVQEPLIQTQEAKPSTPPPRKAKPARTKPPAHPWPATAPPTANPNASPASSTPPWSLMLAAVALLVLTLTASLVAGGAWWITRTLDGRARATEEPPATVATTAPETTAPASPSKVNGPSPPAPPPQEKLVLSGVVEGLGDPYAVINGAIVGVGEQVGEATLLEIVKGTVKLRLADGREVTLRVPR